MKVTVQSNKPILKVDNFVAHGHIHPTERLNDTTGQENVRRMARDGCLEYVRLYTMMEHIVTMDDSGKLQEYYPLIKREDVVPQEVDSFLSRVFDGSVRMMISALTDQKSLTKKDIAELRHILDEAEQNGKE
jgi:uncharacterized protein YcgL (UPF0745 family)